MVVEPFIIVKDAAELAAEREAAEEQLKAEQERKAAIEKAKAEKLAAYEKAKWRTWTISGRRAEAKFSGIGFGKVRLVNRDGSKTTIPLEELSDDDRAWIEKRKK